MTKLMSVRILSRIAFEIQVPVKDGVEEWHKKGEQLTKSRVSKAGMWLYCKMDTRCALVREGITVNLASVFVLVVTPTSALVGRNKTPRDHACRPCRPSSLLYSNSAVWLTNDKSVAISTSICRYEHSLNRYK